MNRIHALKNVGLNAHISTLLFILGAFFSMPHVLAQSPRESMNDIWLTEPRVAGNIYHFQKRKLSLQTDGFIHYGSKYTSHYRVVWKNDSTFALKLKRQISQYELLPKRRRRLFKASFDFMIDRSQDWSVQLNPDGSYTLTSIRPNDAIATKAPLLLILIVLPE